MLSVQYWIRHWDKHQTCWVRDVFVRIPNHARLGPMKPLDQTVGGRWYSPPLFLRFIDLTPLLVCRDVRVCWMYAKLCNCGKLWRLGKVTLWNTKVEQGPSTCLSVPYCVIWNKKNAILENSHFGATSCPKPLSDRSLKSASQNKLAKARKMRKPPGTLSLKKVWAG